MPLANKDFENLIEDDVITIDDDDDGKKKTQNKMDYSKIAAGLDRYKNICNIHLPDINKSKLSFTPNVETNSILYGLKGICKVTEPVISEIMNNRPFSSLEDFLNRVTKRVVTKDKVINLIKCGAFDEIEGKDRSEILKDFIWTVCEPKKRITLQNLNMLIDLELLPSSLDYVSDVYKLTKELRKHRDAEKCGILETILIFQKIKLMFGVVFLKIVVLCRKLLNMKAKLVEYLIVINGIDFMKNKWI